MWGGAEGLEGGRRGGRLGGGGWTGCLVQWTGESLALEGVAREVWIPAVCCVSSCPLLWS